MIIISISLVIISSIGEAETMRGQIKRKQSYNSYLNNILNSPYSILVKSINSKGQICRVIKEGDVCFCGHKINFHLDSQNDLKCSLETCNCQRFCYLPSMSIKCLCKHSTSRHDNVTRQCNQCSGCLSFNTNWNCNCGLKILEHTCKSEKVMNRNGLHAESSSNIVKKGKKDKFGSASAVVLPKLKKEEGIAIFYPQKDSIKQNLSLSRVEKYKIDKYGSAFVENEVQQDYFLKQKLRKANERYFARFKLLQQNKEEAVEELDKQKTAFDLFIQPHFYRNCSLTALNTSLVQNHGRK